jgi:hypothetical protein
MSNRIESNIDWIGSNRIRIKIFLFVPVSDNNIYYSNCIMTKYINASIYSTFCLSQNSMYYYQYIYLRSTTRMLICRALARSWAPCGPISLLRTSSEVSVCVKSVWLVNWEKKGNEEGLMLLCWFLKHWQDLVLLVVQFYCFGGLVQRPSVWKVRQWWSEEKNEKNKNWCYLVDLKSIGKTLCSPWSDFIVPQV